MNYKFLLSSLLGLVTLTTVSLPIYAQPKPHQFQLASPDDVSAIINLVRGWGAVSEVAVINDYAILNYFYGQNGGNVTFRRQNNRWKIIDGRRQREFCFDPDCLVGKEVPRDIATQLLNRVETSRDRHEQELQSFRQAWSKANQSVAPFLGYWPNQLWPNAAEITISIWPSPTAGRVCVVGISEREQYVEVGRVSGRRIDTPRNSFELTDSFQTGDSISSSNAYLIGAQPLNTLYFNAQTQQNLREAGCTSSLPK
jgi:hypothetical protein